MSGVQVAVGDVFYLHCGLCNPPKPKFFVVAQVVPVLRMFLINSVLSAYDAQSQTSWLRRRGYVSTDILF